MPKMSFASDHRMNPSDNPFLAWLVHVVVAAVACICGYYSLVEGTFAPLACGAIAVFAMEALWLYFRLRR
jgi:hypothetical protein